MIEANQAVDDLWLNRSGDGVPWQGSDAPYATKAAGENFLKLTILILHLMFNNCILSFYL